MNGLIFIVAWLLGAGVLGWMGQSVASASPLGLGVVATVAAVYLAGSLELFQYRRSTQTLVRALAQPPGTAGLDAWLVTLDSTLRSPVRSRIEGERVGLPVPAFTPYLVGLLVMLGLLGTFVGMVETLKGSVLALETEAGLEAMRSSLAAPIRGLGLAFATSVAGVAASAMLGLMSTLCRRDRLLAVQQLDALLPVAFAGFSLRRQQHEIFATLREQGAQLPAVAVSLQQLIAQLGEQGERLALSLGANQQAFHETTSRHYEALAVSVNASLQASLAQGARLATETIQPVIERMLTEVATEVSRSTAATQQALGDAVQQQLGELSAQVRAVTGDVTSGWQETLAAQVASQQEVMTQVSRLVDQLEQTLEQRLQSVAGQFSMQAEQLTGAFGKLLSAQETQARERAKEEDAHAAQTQALMAALVHETTSALTTLRADESARIERVMADMAALEGSVAKHLEKLGQGLEAPLTRLIDTASETPRAAAEVIGHLRRELSDSLERDNQLLAERRNGLAELHALAESLQQVAESQQSAVERLLQTSADMLAATGSRFSERVAEEMNRVTEAADHFSASSIELATLGEAFSGAMQCYGESNGQLVSALNHIEKALEKSAARNDEQLGYYVAQAREVIDHSLMSQKEIFEELRQLGLGHAKQRAMPVGVE